MTRHLGSEFTCGRVEPKEAWRILAQAGDAVAWRWLGLALMLVTAGGLAAGLAPLALKALVDALARSGVTPVGDGLVLRLTGAYVGALLLQRLFEQGQAFAYGLGEQRVVRRLSAQTFVHLLRLPLGYLVDVRAGALAQTLAEGVIGWRLICTHLVLTLAPVGVQLVVAVGILGGALGPLSAFVFLGALCAYAAIFAWGGVRLSAPVKAVTASQVELGGLTADALMNVEAIKAFTAEIRFAQRYDGALNAAERHWRAFYGRRLENGLLVASVFAVTVGIAVMMASRRVEAHGLTVGGFVLVMTYLVQLIRPLETAGFAVRDIGQGRAYLDALFAVRGCLPEAAGPPAPAAAPPLVGAAELVFEDVSFAFDPLRPTLRGVTFSVPAGALVGVVGPSGAGKSSLLRLILRFFEPTAGRILLDGRPLADWPLETLRRQIALVSQDTILFNDTIAENIGFAADAPDEAAVSEAATVANLSELLRALPKGLQTRVGERGLKLSGGEKQRVSIARAALKKARLVICDEATAALDPATEQAVWKALSGLAKTTTTLVVTHRLVTVARADQILVLDQGAIVERGRHEELIAAGGLYARLWRAQGAAEAATRAAV